VLDLDGNFDLPLILLQRAFEILDSSLEARFQIVDAIAIGMISPLPINPVLPT
jgi:hypothetical protein